MRKQPRTRCPPRRGRSKRVYRSQIPEIQPHHPQTHHAHAQTPTPWPHARPSPGRPCHPRNAPARCLRSTRADESKHLARIQELEETERKNSARLAELEKTFSSLLSLAHAKENIEAHTTPKHHIVVREDMVYVADGLDLSAYARVKLPLFQRLKRWAMGQ